ncbi:hypothetical protein HK100_005566 [Physocladia obscura]|uniref:Uncharacterized protein n=1 Tax=Physocladia obscura TaxID=109957 RepID=A0AAD5TFF4_9FUNG|nr:hypothetical protein HK100_005566 [Physocladia obscura]
METTHILQVAGAVGGCAIVVVVGVTVARFNRSKAQQTNSEISGISSPYTVSPYRETPSSAYSNAMSNATSATSATSIDSNNIETPYTTLPMGGFHRESLRPMAEVETTEQGSYLISVQPETGTSTKLLSSLIQK